MKNRNGWPLLPLLGASALVLLGIAMVLWPDAVIGAFPPLIGVVLIFYGTAAVAQVLALRHTVKDPAFRLLRGGIAIAVGAVFIIKSDLSLAFMAILFGLYVLVASGIDLSQALQLRRAGKEWTPEFWAGMFGLLLGMMLLLGPFTGQALWARVLGCYFVVLGSGFLRWLLQLKKQPPDAGRGPDEDAKTE